MQIPINLIITARNELEWAKFAENGFKYQIFKNQSFVNISKKKNTAWSVRIRNFSGPYFTAFGLNRERYSVNCPKRIMSFIQFMQFALDFKCCHTFLIFCVPNFRVPFLRTSWFKAIKGTLMNRTIWGF